MPQKAFQYCFGYTFHRPPERPAKSKTTPQQQRQLYMTYMCTAAQQLATAQLVAATALAAAAAA